MLVYLIEVYEGWGEGGTPKVKYYLRTVSLSVRRTRYYFLYRIYYDVLITGIADYYNLFVHFNPQPPLSFCYT